MDIFIEKIVKRQKTSLDYFYMAGVVLLALVLVSVVLMASAVVPFIEVFRFLLIAGVIYMTWRLVRRKNIEYEYAVTNGDLDIDIIYDQRSRKRVFSQNCREFEILAPYPGQTGLPDLAGRTLERLEAVSSMEAADIYYLIAVQDQKRMLDSFKQLAPRKIHIRQPEETANPA